MANRLISLYSTKRLDLIASTLELVTADLKSQNLLALMLNAVVTPEWPPGDYDKYAMEYFRTQFIKGGKELTGWLGWYAVKKASGKQPAVLIASGGFFGPPSELGEVEIGYSVVPSCRKQGYAAEIINALVDIAAGDSRMKRIIARTTKSNIASRAVLEKTGFKYTGSCDSDGNILFEKILKP
jgi:RimJ/RimL family protein N-acetyltransferase